MFLVRIIEDKKSDAYLGQIRLSKGYTCQCPAGFCFVLFGNNHMPFCDNDNL